MHIYIYIYIHTHISLAQDIPLWLQEELNAQRQARSDTYTPIIYDTVYLLLITYFIDWWICINVCRVESCSQVNNKERQEQQCRSCLRVLHCGTASV